MKNIYTLLGLIFLLGSVLIVEPNIYQTLKLETFDALVAYTDNVLDTIDVLTEVLDEHYENLNTTECLLLMQQVKENIDKSVEIEEFLSQYVSLTVH